MEAHRKEVSRKFQDENANFKIGFAVLPCFANALLFFDPLGSGEEGLPEFGEEGTSWQGHTDRYIESTKTKPILGRIARSFS